VVTVASKSHKTLDVDAVIGVVHNLYDAEKAKCRDIYWPCSVACTHIARSLPSSTSCWC